MSFSAVCVWAGARVLFIGIVCAILCAYMPTILCACVFAMLCMKMFVNFVRLYTTDLYNYGYLRIVCFSVSCKALYCYLVSWWTFFKPDLYGSCWTAGRRKLVGGMSTCCHRTLVVSSRYNDAFKCFLFFNLLSFLLITFLLLFPSSLIWFYW